MWGKRELTMWGQLVCDCKFLRPRGQKSQVKQLAKQTGSPNTQTLTQPNMLGDSQQEQQLGTRPKEGGT